jgi:hypothetical protein
MTARLPSFALVALVMLLAFVHGAWAASPGDDAEIRALRAQLQQMKSDTLALDARLRELEAGRDAGSRPSATREAVPPMQAERAPMPPQVPMYAPRGPTLRQAGDPAPYEAAVDTRLGMFRVAFSPYRWIPVGSRQLVLFNTYDEAYLLDFARECPGLLTAPRIRVENFSTRVKAGEHAVVADGQRCVITTIRGLRISKLPKALRP